MIPEDVQDLAPSAVDLTDPTYQATVREAAGRLEATLATAEAARGLERRLVDTGEPAPIALRVALKLAMSRLALTDLAEPVHLSVVFAVYKEHVRILSRDESPHGEDFLREKLAQLDWLFARTAHHSWDMTIVDDGCPEGSGRLARRLVGELGAGDRVSVLFLDDAIRDGLPVARTLASTDGSRKGGSIRYGFWHALRGEYPNHILLYTDADLSTDLGQAGLLVEPIAEPGTSAASGARRRPESVVVKGESRNTRGKLFIYLWKRLIPQLAGVVDTQCGFKAFRSEQIASWLEDTSENGFAFDIEYLLRVELDAPGSLETVPIAWIDSEAQSTTSHLQPYLPMLKSVVELYRRYEHRTDVADGFAALIEELDPESFDRLLTRVPAAIAERDPIDFDSFDGVTARELADAAFARAP